MTDRFQKRRTTRGQPRGVILVAVLVALFVVTLLAATPLRAMLARQRQATVQQHQVQAMWLAQSAMNRARAALRDSADYQGASWQVPAEQLDGKNSGLAKIVVEQNGDMPNQRTIRVEALFPDDPVHRVRHVSRVVLTISDDQEKNE